MSAFSELIRQTGLIPPWPAEITTSRLIHAHWLENLVIGLLLILCAALVLQGVWNGLLAEFPQIGRLSYFRAVHLVALLGVFATVIWFIFF